MTDGCVVDEKYHIGIEKDEDEYAKEYGREEEYLQRL
jgi:hypothetical protein